MSRNEGKWLVIASVIFVTLIYWIPKIAHDLRAGW